MYIRKIFCRTIPRIDLTISDIEAGEKLEGVMMATKSSKSKMKDTYKITNSRRRGKGGSVREVVKNHGKGCTCRACRRQNINC